MPLVSYQIFPRLQQVRPMALTDKTFCFAHLRLHFQGDMRCLAIISGDSGLRERTISISPGHSKSVKPSLGLDAGALPRFYTLFAEPLRFVTTLQVSSICCFEAKFLESNASFQLCEKRITYSKCLAHVAEYCVVVFTCQVAMTLLSKLLGRSFSPNMGDRIVYRSVRWRRSRWNRRSHEGYHQNLNVLNSLCVSFYSLVCKVYIMMTSHVIHCRIRSTAIPLRHTNSRYSGPEHRGAVSLSPLAAQPNRCAGPRARFHAGSSLQC
eukprot:6193073-Pleurochrysis_carterae.AAC.2